MCKNSLETFGKLSAEIIISAFKDKLKIVIIFKNLIFNTLPNYFLVKL